MVATEETTARNIRPSLGEKTRVIESSNQHKHGVRRRAVAVQKLGLRELVPLDTKSS